MTGFSGTTIEIVNYCYPKVICLALATSGGFEGVAWRGSGISAWKIRKSMYSYSCGRSCGWMV